MAWLENLLHLDVSSSWGFLLLGFLIGLVHALEADHLAAVATMAKGKKRLFLRGAAWGTRAHLYATYPIHCCDCVQLCLVISRSRCA